MLKVTNLEQFQQAIRDFQEKTKRTPERAAKEIILELMRQTIMLTPVDTGRLVGGWQTSVTNSQPTFSTNPYDGALPGQNETQVRMSQLSRIEKLSGTGKIYWLANNVEYARYQEYGTGKMRGKFMFQTALKKVQARAEELARQAME